MRRDTVVLTSEPDGDDSSVAVPALPECFTEGDTVEDAREMAKDEIVTYLECDPAREWPAPVGVIVAEVDAPIGGRTAYSARRYRHTPRSGPSPATFPSAPIVRRSATDDGRDGGEGRWRGGHQRRRSMRWRTGTAPPA